MLVFWFCCCFLFYLWFSRVHLLCYILLSVIDLMFCCYLFWVFHKKLECTFFLKKLKAKNIREYEIPSNWNTVFIKEMCTWAKIFYECWTREIKDGRNFTLKSGSGSILLRWLMVCQVSDYEKQRMNRSKGNKTSMTTTCAIHFNHLAWHCGCSTTYLLSSGPLFYWQDLPE